MGFSSGLIESRNNVPAREEDQETCLPLPANKRRLKGGTDFRHTCLTACGCILAAFLFLTATGCQTGTPTVSNRTLVAHLPGIDFSGLDSMKPVDSVKVSCSLPSKWAPLRLDRNALYTHQQWKSPTGYTGAGVVYARLPIPLNAKTLLWFAKLEYSKKSESGRATGQWTDSLGRPWFEAENEKYHVRGYAVVSGLNAWIVYFGYKITRPASPSELSLAARCVDTVIPQTGERVPEKSAVAQDAR